MGFQTFNPSALAANISLSQRLAAFDMLFTAPGDYGENDMADPEANRLTREYSPFCNAPFLGNGVLGAMLWQDAGFFRLMASGGIAVSAARKEGTVQWLCLESPGAQSRILQIPQTWEPGKLCIRASEGVRWQQTGSTALTVEFPAGKTWLLATAQEDVPPEFPAGHPVECHWGNRKPSSLSYLENQAR